MGGVSLPRLTVLAVTDEAQQAETGQVQMADRVFINELLELVSKSTTWQSGDPNYVYLDDGVISGPFLEALVVLASRAPGKAKMEFLERWNG